MRARDGRMHNSHKCVNFAKIGLEGFCAQGTELGFVRSTNAGKVRCDECRGATYIIDNNEVPKLARDTMVIT